jgi:hypothetical protein
LLVAVDGVRIFALPMAGDHPQIPVPVAMGTTMSSNRHNSLNGPPRARVEALRGFDIRDLPPGRG